MLWIVVGVVVVVLIVGMLPSRRQREIRRDQGRSRLAIWMPSLWGSGPGHDEGIGSGLRRGGDGGGLGGDGPL